MSHFHGISSSWEGVTLNNKNIVCFSFITRIPFYPKVNFCKDESKSILLRSRIQTVAVHSGSQLCWQGTLIKSFLPLPIANLFALSYCTPPQLLLNTSIITYRQLTNNCQGADNSCGPDNNEITWDIIAFVSPHESGASAANRSSVITPPITVLVFTHVYCSFTLVVRIVANDKRNKCDNMKAHRVYFFLVVIIAENFKYYLRVCWRRHLFSSRLDLTCHWYDNNHKY